VFRTPLCDLLEIVVPVVQAPIGQASSPALVAAVSNAGALGMLSGTWRSVDELRSLVGEIGSRTNRPFGVNLVLEWPQQERVEVCLSLGVPVLSFFWGDPSAYMGDVHAAGAVVMQTVGSAAEARAAVALGVDVVVAQGWEAGGHVWGQVATLPLVPAVVDAVAPVPVVAAGGIADGRGMAAALALGAAGVWVGTRFLASDESTAHEAYKEAVLRSEESGTAYTTLFDEGWQAAPHRVLRNSTVRAWEHAGRPARGTRPAEGSTVARLPDGTPVVRYADSEPVVGMSGDVEALAMYAGQSAGLVREVKPAAVIVEELVAEARRALTGALGG
jgi:NAD(P)H-dependent flavin oxidoreductase YrpB (nitropropane dioxygenase family)